MSHPRRRALALITLPVWIGLFLFLPARPAAAGTVTTPTSCTNNAQPGTTALPITLTGTATPATAVAGVDTITLSGATFGIDVPGTVLLAGYSLGLLSAGVNNIPANVNLTLLGANTAEGSAVLPPLSVTGTTTITDPTPANKTSGDETATPLSVSANLPTTTWTPTGGDVGISLGSSSTSALVGPGGIITVTFSCTPGTPTPAGCGPAPLTACTGTNPVPALPFTTVSVTGGVSTTSTTTTSTLPTTTTTAAPTTTSTTGTTAPTTSTTAPLVPTPVSGTASYTTTCSNSVTPDLSELAFEVAGTTISPVEAGQPISLSKQTWKVTVPASVLQTGIGLGLLHPGDTPSGLATVSLFATNTKEGTLSSAPVTIAVGPIAVDGGGQALPATTSFAVPDLTWTAVGGEVAFSMAKATVQVTIGPIQVAFSCTPKAPVATIVAAGVRGTTDIPAAAPGTSVQGEQLARTGLSAGAQLALAFTLLDIGYLALSATWPTRQGRRHRTVR